MIKAELARESAERNVQARMDSMSDTAERLGQAETSMTRMLEKVNKETIEVERATRDLVAAKKATDPLLNLKSGGLVKQGALVGFILFSTRTIGEVLAMVGPNGDLHTAPALIQGGVALACAAYYFLF